MMNNKFPEIKKSISNFVYDEEGSIPREKVLLIGSMVLLMNLMMTQDVFAKHYSHSSHKSHSSHSSSRHGNHSNHANHNNSITINDININKPESTPTMDGSNLINSALSGSMQSLGETPKFSKKIK